MRDILTAFTSGDSQVATIGGLRRSGLIRGVNPDGTFQPGDDFDATPPPAPTGLSSGGALANIILSWDATTYSNLSHTEIWRAQTNDFSLAQLVGRGDGRIYVDNVGGAAVRYYWIRYISRANIPGPFNAQSGVRGETGIDAAYLLSVMTNQITQEQLYGDLGARIDLIDGPPTLAGSVSARMATEAKTRSDADGAMATKTEQLQAIVTDPTTGLVDKYAAVKMTAEATATALGKVQAKWAVEVGAGGVAGGFGIIGTGDGLTGRIDFGVRANSFFVAAPSGAGMPTAIPFIVRTTASTINGVNVPAGIYMADAFIANGAISNAKIGNAAIDDAKIANLDAGKITTGYIDAARISVGSLDAKIANLGAAVITSGYIDKARINNASIANVTIQNAQIENLDAAKVTSGYMSAERIAVGSFDAKIANISTAQIAMAKISNAQFSGDMWSDNWEYGKAGWYLARNGNLYANNGEFRGNLSGAGGTFSGTLTAKEVIVTDNIIADGISSVDIFPNGFVSETFIVSRKSKVLLIASCAVDSNSAGGFVVSKDGVNVILATNTRYIQGYTIGTVIAVGTLEAGLYNMGANHGDGSARVLSMYVLKVMK
ncbi:phage tail tip fiber protein [Janthinobacterium sp. CG3]|uniref:phage tail tip fiber protein n=1 Tax=Janthinobacterium sp. CG3 TaxID=1075768 RepID=UPI00036BF56C|nr:DUF1983 domain-containing protein [Janthinobacterium sp. CG3]